jgi:hypothetical protein
MPCHICLTCGTQFPESASPPGHCAICEDERQYIGFRGQQWTTLEELRRTYKNEIAEQEPGLTEIHTRPQFAIGQRALLLETPRGNILWDCISLLDEATINNIRGRGGLAAIAISHPHYYTTMVEWSRVFDDVPVFLHAGDRQWVMRPDPCIRFWDGEELELEQGARLVRCGGHFTGGTVLYWPAGAGGRGALLTGDIFQVTPDSRWVSFMYSYPNYIPMNAATVRKVTGAVTGLQFDRIYGAFPHLTVKADGKGAIARSVERYLLAIR